MDKDDIVISDVGANKVWIARHYNCYEPNTCLISNGFATIGASPFPAPFSAKLVHPDKKFWPSPAMSGFLMNVQEFETAYRLGT